MAEQDFLQNTGTQELPTNKSQAIANLMGADKPDEFDKLVSKVDAEDKKRKEEQKYQDEMRDDVSKFQEKGNSKYTPKEEARRKDIEDSYKALAKRANLQKLKARLQSIKATGAVKYQREKRPGQPLPPNPSRFYSPDTTFGVDDGVRRIGRFPMGAGLTYHLPPLISTNAQGQARAGLKIKKPPMFGGM